MTLGHDWIFGKIYQNRNISVINDEFTDEEAEVSTNPAGGAKGGAKKSTSKKEEATVIDKTLYKIKSAVVSKSEKVVKQTTLELPTTDSKVSQDTDNSKLTKPDSVEDKTITHAEINENTETKSKDSSNLEHVDDEYVNIVDTKLHTVHNALKDSIEHNSNVTEDVEYAQVVKTKTKDVHENINETRQTVQSCMPVQELKLDTSKPLNAEVNQMNNETIVKETKEKLKVENTEDVPQQTALKSGETAFSNMIYSDEEFRATLAGKTKTKTDNENKEESDAYVELLQVAGLQCDKETPQEQVELKKEIEIKSADSESNETVVEVAASDVTSIPTESANKTQQKVVGGDNSNNVGDVFEKTDSVQHESEPVKPVTEEVEKQSVKEVESSLIILPDASQATESNENDIQETIIKTNKEGSVIVLKDVGVQVPDIYMPLDKDKDFGFTANNNPCVSIGIQVTDKDLDIEHVVVSINKEDDKENVSPAFFWHQWITNHFKLS